jgi:hypothetical protein
MHAKSKQIGSTISRTSAACGAALALLLAATAASQASWFGDVFSSIGLSPKSDAPAEAESLDVNCPSVDVPSGTATYQLFERAGQTEMTDLRYQGYFRRFARECKAEGDNVSIRVGVAGRLVTGPKGASGQTLELPIRFVLADTDDKPVVSRLVKVKVSIPANEGGEEFQQVEDLGPIPMPPGKLNGWKLLVGFDVKAAPAEKKPARPRVAHHPRRHAPATASGPNLPPIGGAAPRAAARGGPNLPPINPSQAGGGGGPNLPPIDTGGRIASPAPATQPSSGPNLPPIVLD